MGQRRAAALLVITLATLPACDSDGGCDPPVLGASAILATDCPMQVVVDGQTFSVTCMPVHRTWFGDRFGGEGDGEDYAGARELHGIDKSDAFALIPNRQACNPGGIAVGYANSLSPSQRRELRSPREPAISRSATRFGSGRIPMGSVELCPSRTSWTGPRETQEAAVEILTAADSESPAPDTLWRLLEPRLRRAFGSREKFREQMRRAPYDPTYNEWDYVKGLRSLRLLPIKDFCPQLELRHVARVDVFFPSVVGISGGSAQLFFVGVEHKPRLWFVY